MSKVFDKIMELNPTLLYSFVNELGQRVDVLEHPLKGDDSPPIVCFPDEKAMFVTEFYDIEQTGEYQPVYVDGKCMCMYEMEPKQ